MAKLARSVFVTDPDQPGVSLCLEAGQEVPARLQHLVTTPDAWEDGELPDAQIESGDDAPPSGDTKPAAKKTATAPSRGGRKTAAAEGSGSGQ